MPHYPTISEIAQRLTADSDVILEWSDEPPASNWVDPDALLRTDGSITFICDENNKLWYSKDKTSSHAGIIRANRELIQDFEKNAPARFWPTPENNFYRRDGMEHLWLNGRLGLVSAAYNAPKSLLPDRKIVTFWNQQSEIYNKQLKPCLEQLINDGYLTIDDYFSTPIHQTRLISTILNSNQSSDRQLSDEELEHVRLRNELHLGQGDKKEIRNKLGLVQGSKKNPTQQALEKADMITPGHKWWAPHSEYFNKQLKKTLNEWSDEPPICKWIDPDKLYRNNGAVAFIDDENDKLWYSNKKNETHGEIIRRNSELKQNFDDHAPPGTAEYYGHDRRFMENVWLAGRLGPTSGIYKAEEYGFSSGSMICCFWNTQSAIYDKQLKSCLRQLIDDGHLTVDDYFSTPIHQTRLISTLLSSSESSDRQLSDEELEHIRLRNELHLGQGDKREIRNKLGLIQASKKNPNQAALEKAGMITPGHKWWAPHSESFNKQLNKILNEWDHDALMQQHKNKYIDPDDLYDAIEDDYKVRDTLTFIFTKDNKLLTDGDTHVEIAHNLGLNQYVPNNEPDLNSETDYDSDYDSNYESDSDYGSAGYARHSLGLSGRTLYDYKGQNIVSFWNNNINKDWLIRCLQILLDDGHIDQTFKVSTPDLGTIPLQNVMAGTAESRQLSQDELEKLELRRNLHIMRGAAKQDAMKQLGLMTHSKKNPNQAALEKANLITPGHKWWAPHSENFNKQLNKILLEWQPNPESYIDPDEVYTAAWTRNRQAIAFIYTLDHELYISNETHNDIISKHPKLANEYYGLGRSDVWQTHLRGRIGDVGGHQIVSFWNDNTQLLAPCLQALAEYINPEAFVSTPKLRTKLLSEVLGGQSTERELTPEEKEHIELRQQLHLGRGDKKEIRNKLGLIQYSKKHPYQSALEKASLITPGHKWHSMTSEDRMI